MNYLRILNHLLNLNYIYDPNLIAGLVIQVGSVMVDTSIKSKLKQTRKKYDRGITCKLIHLK